MYRLLFFALLAACVVAKSPAQFALGPKTGSLPSGFAVNTDQFDSFTVPGGETDRLFPGNPETLYLPAPKDVMPPTGPEGSNYIEDKGTPLPPGNRPVLIKNFLGIPDQGGFPPDPIMAVGPNHVLACVNSTFRIFDKNGTVLKTIAASSWFNTIAPGSGPNDPQVIYDHFHNRWVMQWMTSPTATEHFHMFCVSDDDNPIGLWYQWKTSATVVGDSATPNWGDYPQMGYDNQAIYLTSRQFTLAGGFFQYSKVRIIPSAQLYLNNAGPIVWKDFWDLRDPGSPGVAPDGVMASIVYGTPGVFFLVNDSPFRPGTYFTLRTITNPAGTPTITAVNIPVVAYNSAPNPSQLGGGTAIEGGGSRIRSRTIYRDSSLYAVHSVASTSGYGAVRYVRINTFTMTTTEDIAMGLDGFWHFYPTLMVDQDKSIILGFSRSGLTEYIGAYLSGRRNTDPPNYLAPSAPVKTGEANYIRVGSNRNRWGDYNGIGLDPADGVSVWTLTEYAASPNNTWSTWIGQAKMGPLPGAVINSDRSSLNLGLVEAGFTSDTVVIGITNNGVDTLSISSITKGQAAYQLLSLPAFPAKIATYDTLKFRVIFRPTLHGTINDTIRIASNDANRPVVTVPTSARGIVIGRAQPGPMYATSATLGSVPSQLFTINPANGVATPVGPTGLSEIDGLAIHPTTKELYGTQANSLTTTLYRISSIHGDALSLRNLGIPNLRAIAFSLTGDTLYGGTTTGRLYRIHPATGDTTYIGTLSGKPYSGFSISPTSNQLWASVRPPLTGRDSIYIVNRSSGTAMTVGRTGLNVITPYIAFNKAGNLFALIGTSTQTNTLYSLDTLTATGTLIGSTGVSGLLAIAMRTDSAGVVGVEEGTHADIPSSFELGQNYPNPFNPTTTLVYALPRAGHVSLKLFNVLGQEVATLIDGMQDAGYKSIQFNAENLASGVYLYELRSGEFVATRKLLLLR